MKTQKVINVFIGSHLNEIRENSKISVDVLAKAIGLTRASISNMEAGRQQISIDKLFDIAIFFNEDILQFLPSKEWYSQTKHKQIRKVVTYDIID